MRTRRKNVLRIPRVKPRGAPVPPGGIIGARKRKPSRAPIAPEELAEAEEELRERRAMAEKVVVYHNPRCGTSRKTLELLRARGVEPEVIEYLINPPTKSQLRTLLGKLGLKPSQLVRTKEPIYREMKLGEKDASEDAILNAMANHPILIERPIVVRGEKAALGRPPEKALEVL